MAEKLKYDALVKKLADTCTSFNELAQENTKLHEAVIEMKALKQTAEEHVISDLEDAFQ